MFGFLCRLEHFDLSGNPGLDQSTLAGYLACTQKNLKDATRIDARGKGLKGEGSASVLSTFIRFVTFTFPVGELPAQLCKWTKLTHLDVSVNKLTGERSVPGLSGFICC